jgi:hypothetical protein
LSILTLPLAFPVYADFGLLVDLISEYNLKALKRSLDEETYRGEAGILRMNPVVGKSLGLTVHIDESYQTSTELYERAEENLNQAFEDLKLKTAQENERLEHIVDLFLQYKSDRESAGLKISAYYSRLKPGLDDRLDDNLCRRLMEKLLATCLQEGDYQLRDALARFHNLCQGKDADKHQLTVDNVRFVNFVYRNFMDKSGLKEKEPYHYDRQRDPAEFLKGGWQEITASICPRYLGIFEKLIPRYHQKMYQIDPLLFMALIKRESDFNPLAVSSVGAAGLTQIMPATAVDLGMKNIYRPEYYQLAGKLLRREREAQQAARAVLFMIDNKDGLKYARQARKLTQKSISLARERERLFTKYKYDLLKSATDSRLDPEQSLEHGLRYFLRQMKARKGDISLALASYNAGPYRVKQYQGIPPFEETVRFRNTVLAYYRKYVKLAQGMGRSTAESVRMNE